MREPMPAHRPPPVPSPWPVLATLVAVAVAAVPAARADAPPLAAPLGVTTPGPIRQLFLDPTIADARAVSRAGLQLRLETANSWSVPTVMVRGADTMKVQNDVQADGLVVSGVIPWSLGAAGAGWRDRIATTVGWRLTEFWGGFEDGGIEAWHRFIGSTNFLRDRYPPDHVNLQFASADGRTALDLHSARFAWGDLVVGTQALLAAGGQSGIRGANAGDPSWGVAARLDLKLPIGALDRAGGSGGFDAALSALASVELARWIVVHGRASAALFSGFSADVPLQPRTFHWSAEASVVLIAGGWAFVLEDRLVSPLFDGNGWTVLDGGNDDFYIASAAMALFRTQNQITGAIRYGRFTFSFSEDFTPGSNPRSRARWFYNSNAPDVVVALSVRLL
jgi:hypothetical protein